MGFGGIPQPRGDVGRRPPPPTAATTTDERMLGVSDLAPDGRIGLRAGPKPLRSGPIVPARSGTATPSPEEAPGGASEGNGRGVEAGLAAEAPVGASAQVKAESRSKAGARAKRAVAPDLVRSISETMDRRRPPRAGLWPSESRPRVQKGVRREPRHLKSRSSI